MTASRRGILLMAASAASFAVQDGFSRYLAEGYNTLMVVAIRYWVFLLFVLWLAMRRPEGIRAAVASHRLGVHVLRAVLLVAEICVMVYAYTRVGLIESHAVFAACPLLVMAMSGPLLGERISARRWVAVAAGCAGVLVILRPGAGVFAWVSLLPLASAFMFGLYSVLTRLAARDEGAFATFFWPAAIGAVLMTGIGLPFMQPVAPADLPVFAAYAAVSILSNWVLQKTYQAAEASAVQPFAYLQIVFVTGIGVMFFDERIAPAVLIGTAIVVGAGLHALVVERGKAG